MRRQAVLHLLHLVTFVVAGSLHVHPPLFDHTSLAPL